MSSSNSEHASVIDAPNAQLQGEMLQCFFEETALRLREELSLLDEVTQDQAPDILRKFILSFREQKEKTDELKPLTEYGLTKAELTDALGWERDESGYTPHIFASRLCACFIMETFLQMLAIDNDQAEIMIRKRLDHEIGRYKKGPYDFTTDPARSDIKYLQGINEALKERIEKAKGREGSIRHIFYRQAAGISEILRAFTVGAKLETAPGVVVDFLNRNVFPEFGMQYDAGPVDKAEAARFQSLINYLDGIEP